MQLCLAVDGREYSSCAIVMADTSSQSPAGAWDEHPCWPRPNENIWKLIM